MSMRVAVIGAGPSGLVAVKELLDEGHEPTCLEQAGGLGGVFRFDEESGVVWASCRLTSSGLLTAFSDFPVSTERSGHMTAAEYVDYLTAYCAEFGVGERIRFGTKVVSVTRDPDGGWCVRSVDTGGERAEHYDAVAICSGLHQHPHRAHFEGEETFRGEILHGSEYRRPAQVAGKRVLVVGAGESGADIVAEVSAHATETVLSLRRGVAVLPRKVQGYPNDYRTCRINNSAAHWIFQTRNPKDDSKRRVYKTVFFPFVLLDKGVNLAAARVGRLRASRRARRFSEEELVEARVTKEMIRLIRELLAASGGTLQEQFGTKSADFLRAMANGLCRREGGIARFDGGRVWFEDGNSFEPDLVILCTGFDTKVPFLDQAVAGAQRYLYTIVPAIGRSLGFIGFVRPGFGAIPPLAELQARWFALLLSGEVDLPTEAEMRTSIERLDRLSPALLQGGSRTVGPSRRLHVALRRAGIRGRLQTHAGCAPAREPSVPVALLRRAVHGCPVPARRPARQALDPEGGDRALADRSCRAQHRDLLSSLDALASAPSPAWRGVCPQAGAPLR